MSGKSTILEDIRYAFDRVRPEDLGGVDDERVRERVESLLKSKAERDFGETEGTLLPESGEPSQYGHTGIAPLSAVYAKPTAGFLSVENEKQSRPTFFHRGAR